MTALQGRAAASIIALVAVPIASLPLDLTPYHAVEGAYAQELDQLAQLARRGETALIECDAELVPHLHRALKQRLADASSGRAMSARYVDGRAPDPVPLGGSFELEVRPTSLARALLRQLRALLQEGLPDRLLVVGRFELLAASASDDGEPAPLAREAAALLHDAPDVPVLALHAPDVLVPGPLARAFSRRGLVGPVSTAGLRRLVLRREARKLGVETIELDDLAGALDGLNALELRRALASLEARVDHDPRFPAAREALLAELAALPRRAREPRPMPTDDERAGVEWRLRHRPR